MSRLRRYLVDVLAYLDAIRRGESVRLIADDPDDQATMDEWTTDLEKKGRAILRSLDPEEPQR
jgi:hypothetical protein